MLVSFLLVVQLPPDPIPLPDLADTALLKVLPWLTTAGSTPDQHKLGMPPTSSTPNTSPYFPFPEQVLDSHSSVSLEMLS